MVLLSCLLVTKQSGSAAACDGLISRASEETPFLLDDLALVDLQQSVDRSIVFLSKIKKDEEFEFCGRTFSADHLRLTLEFFSRGLTVFRDEREFQRFLLNNFILCRAKGTTGTGTMLVTGYYEPLLSGSFEKKAPYIYPLYRPPDDLVHRARVDGNNEMGRIVNGEFFPYWTRSEIEQGKLPPGGEILYLADPVDVFVLQVQGSGRVRLQDGSVRKVRYAANNGRQYRSIGRLLVDRGVMTMEEVTLPKIIDYLHAHPDELEGILHYNERYVFFSLVDVKKESLQEGPLGSMGQPLTPGRSMAVDKKCFPAPMVGYLETEMPLFDEKGNLVEWRKMHRFVVNQDSGAAIQGPGRVDLFLGGDKFAEQAAGVMKQPGTLSFFLLKDGKDFTKVFGN
ncbi:MAG: murein transglycosylase A [Pseudomonadota bacterium]